MATNGMTINGLNPLSALTADDKIPVWDTGASGEPTKEITAQNMANSVKSLASLPNTTEMNTAIEQSTADVIRTGDVVNNLTSTATDKPLSAAQGKALNDKIANKQTLTATTDSSGLIVSDIPFTNVRSANVESTTNFYCVCRQSTGGKAVFFVFNIAFLTVANTQVSITVWLA